MDDEADAPLSPPQKRLAVILYGGMVLLILTAIIMFPRIVYFL